MIFKVQISLVSLDDIDRILVYDKDRKIMYQSEDTTEVAATKFLLNGRPKAYFKGKWHEKLGKVILGNEVETQNW